MEKIYINEPDHTDLNMYRCGIEDCKPGHSWGPAVRDHYLIHYVLSGKGIFQIGNSTYNLSKGHGFLLCPNVVAYYQADVKEPWTYTWVGFNGIKAENYLQKANLSLEKPVFFYDKDDFLKDCLSQMIASKDLGKGGEIRLLGLLYIFLSQLVEVADSSKYSSKKGNSRELYVKKAVEFVAMNYSREISVSEIASYVGLDRSYLYTVFMEQLNMSPQEFVISFRINRACELMQNRILSIGDISRSVGYEDPLLFSKTFKKIKNISPREYRKNC